MTSARKTAMGFILPSLVFPGLIALALQFIFGHMFKSGLASKLGNQCLSSTSPYRLDYTGLHALDQQLCSLVTFFHAAMEPVAFPFLAYFLGTSAPLIVIPAVESCRGGRNFTLGYPLIFGFLSQIASVGATMPLYWLLFVLTGASSRQSDARTKVTQGHAEAIVFSVIAGGLIPSAGMFILKDPHVTALWQAFPIAVSLTHLGHLFIRPASRHSESGFNTIRVLYIAIFILSSSSHIATVWPAIGDNEALKALFLPSVDVLPATTTLALQCLDFLKWDATFGFGSTIIGTLWFARNANQLLALVAWYTVAAPVLGPGAAIAGVALWRESSLNSHSTKVITDKKE